jgi:hypothetical protein
MKEYAKKHAAAASEEMNAARKTFTHIHPFLKKIF